MWLNWETGIRRKVIERSSKEKSMEIFKALSPPKSTSIHLVDIRHSSIPSTVESLRRRGVSAGGLMRRVRLVSRGICIMQQEAV